MKIIRSIDVVEVKGVHESYFPIINQSSFRTNDSGKSSTKDKSSAEVVRGYRFQNNKTGEIVEVGMREDVAKVLGYPFECIENMYNNMEKLKSNIIILNEELNESKSDVEQWCQLVEDIYKMSWWQRIKFIIGIHKIKKAVK